MSTTARKQPTLAAEFGRSVPYDGTMPLPSIEIFNRTLPLPMLPIGHCFGIIADPLEIFSPYIERVWFDHTSEADEWLVQSTDPPRLIRLLLDKWSLYPFDDDRLTPPEGYYDECR